MFRSDREKVMELFFIFLVGTQSFEFDWVQSGIGSKLTELEKQFRFTMTRYNHSGNPTISLLCSL